jgi:TetR/AcrR family transcriptional repressor of nem operon
MPRREIDTRQNILETAQRIMAHKGFAAVGLNEILAEAGVPKGSFYHYFTSKDAFGEALLKAYFDDYLAVMDRISSEPGKNSAGHVMEYWQRFYDLQSVDDCQGRCLVVKLGAEVSDLVRHNEDCAERRNTGIVDRIEKMIAGGIEDGSLSTDGSPHAIAEALYDAWLGASVMAKIHRSPESLDRAMSITRQPAPTCLHCPVQHYRAPRPDNAVRHQP